MKNIVFLGHSVLFFFPGNEIGSWQIKNLSKQGIIAAEGLKMAREHQPTLEEADKILIMFGINELYYQMKKETVIENLEKLLQYMLTIKPSQKIILAPLMQTDETKRLKPEKISWVNDQISQLLIKYQITVFSWEKLYNKDGRVEQTNTIDGIHLSRQGYELFKQELLLHLQDD